MKKSISCFIALIFLLPSVLFANELFINDDLACQSGDGEKCESIAVSFYLGGSLLYATEGNTIKASEYFQKACDLNFSRNCAFAGIIYLFDKDIQQDIEKSRELLLKSCILGNELGCSYLELVDAY